MKLNLPEQPVTPQVGQLFYQEYINDEDNSFHSASLMFVDTAMEEGKQWYVTWVAQMEDYGDGNGMQVHLEQEAGGMPAGVTRIATDEDILKFVQAHVQDDPAKVADITEWLESVIQADQYMLPVEKERVASLTGSFLNQKFGVAAV